MGAAFLERTAIQRKTAKPFYIAKLPNNWLYTAFIRLILPNARIIDARRPPLACCFSNFRPNFATGPAFSYGLADVGAYHHAFIRLMVTYTPGQQARGHRWTTAAVLSTPD